MKRNFTPSLKNCFSLLLLSCFVSIPAGLFAQMVGDNIFLPGQFIQAAIAPNGSFGSTVTMPTGYYHDCTSAISVYDHATGSSTSSTSRLALIYDSGHDGWTTGTPAYFGDYTLPGSPYEGWDIQIGAASGTGTTNQGHAWYTNYQSSASGFSGSLAFSGSLTSYTNSGGVIKAVWTGTAGASGALAIVQTTTLDTSASWINVTTTLRNTTGSAVGPIFYQRAFDPDNDAYASGGSTETYDTINYQNDYLHRVEVTASGYHYRTQTIALATKDCRAKCWSGTWPMFGTYSVSQYYSGAGTSGSVIYRGQETADNSIGLTYALGTLAAGDSTVVSYAFVFNGNHGIDSAFPDPKMVIAGIAYDSIDTVGCSSISSSTLPVNLINADTKCWSMSTWTWAPATGLSSTTGVSNTVNMSAISSITTYTITGNDSSLGGCNTKTFLLTIIPPPPSVTITNNSPLCPGDPLTITVTNADTSSSVTYLWSGPGGFTATTQNILIPSSVVADSGLFSVVVNNGGCAQDTSTVVVVHSTPGSPGIADVTYCQYASTVPLTATGSNLLWYNSATGGVGSRVAPVPSSTTAGTFTWYVTQSINNCESARYPINVIINPLPPPPTISDMPGAYCPGSAWNTFTYASGTGSVLWYTAQTGGTGTSVTPVVNTSISGIDTFWASQTILGCEGPRALVTILVYDSVVAHFDTLIHWGCHGDTLYFNNSSFGASYYLWTFGDGTSSADANPSHVYPTQAIDTVKLFAHSAACVDSLIRIFDLRHPDTSRFSVAPSIACQNTPVRFSNTSIATGPTYTWSFGDGSTSTAANPAHTYTNTGTYNIQLIVTDFVPCKDTSYGTVSVDTMSAINIALSDTAFCMGTYVTMDGSFAALGDTQLIWNLGNGNIIYNSNPLSYAYTSPGTYVITALTKYRVCPDATTSRTVTVMNQPIINLGPDTSICPGSELSIALIDGINLHTIGASWLWSTGETGSGISVTTPGVYYATVSVGGCTATDSVVVTNACTYNISNCFSPNGDGVNDYFNPRDNLSKDITSFSMSIYNRWGEMVFQTKSIDGRGWDGSFNATAQPQGVYIYVISATFADGQNMNKTGNLTLLR